MTAIDESAAVGAARPAPSAALQEWSREQIWRRRMVLVGRVIVGVAIIAFWEFSSGRLIDKLFVSSPSAVSWRLWRWLMDGSLWNHLSITLYATAWGFLIGSVVGFVLGLVFGRYQTVADIFDPFITALYSIPKIALAPLFIMGGNEWHVLRHVVVPSAATWVITGLKVSVPYALVGTVIGEFMSANRGIGFVISQATGLFDTTSVFAGLVVLGVVGALINVSLRHVEAKLLRWRG